MRIDLPLLRERNPRPPLSVRGGEGWFRKGFVREAATSDTNGLGCGREEPEESGSSVRAEVTLLIVALCGVVKGIDFRLALRLNHGCLVKVGRDPKRASCPSLAVRAVADAVHSGQRVDRD
jgi:hypothetical protein